jgi:hypothetical protein
MGWKRRIQKKHQNHARHRRCYRNRQLDPKGARRAHSARGARARARARAHRPRAQQGESKFVKCFEESFESKDGDLGSMDGGGSAGAAVQAESGAPIPPAREVRAAHEVLVYKPVVGDLLPNTPYEVTGMSRALNLQVTKYNSAKRKIAEISDTESAEIVVLKRKRDRALHQIKCFAFNFKEGNFRDFNLEASALKVAKVVSANN